MWPNLGSHALTRTSSVSGRASKSIKFGIIKTEISELKIGSVEKQQQEEEANQRMEKVEVGGEVREENKERSTIGARSGRRDCALRLPLFNSKKN